MWVLLQNKTQGRIPHQLRVEPFLNFVTRVLALFGIAPLLILLCLTFCIIPCDPIDYLGNNQE